MAKINYKPLVEEKFEQFKEKHPDYTYGQMLYGALRYLNKAGSRSDFIEMSDEDLYTGLENALRAEEVEDEFFVK